MANISRLKTRDTGAVVVGSDDDADFDNIINNMDPDGVEDASSNIVAMQAMADPYPGESASLATALRGEIQRIRYQLDAIIGKTNWYQDPDTNLLLEFNKGADIASANALALGTDGNYFDVTGTTAITSINTRRVGSVIKLHFDGVLTLTNHATDLVLPGGVNITTAAGDEAEFVEYDTGKWRCTNHSGGALLKTKKIDIGDWNMDATATRSIAHGLTFANIINTDVQIRADANTEKHSLRGRGGYNTLDGSWLTDATYVRLWRTTLGNFDTPTFDATSYNRGWILITYI